MNGRRVVFCRSTREPVRMVSSMAEEHIGTMAQCGQIHAASGLVETVPVLRKIHIQNQFRRILPRSVKLFYENLKPLLKKDVLISRIQCLLRERLKREISLCGVLIDVCGRGVLIRGESGTGKSGSALELIPNGGRLVSDDVVTIRRIPEGGLIGRSPDRTKHMIAIRNLGIVNVRNLFGVSAIRDEHPVHLVVELSGMKKAGPEHPPFMRILGVEMPVYEVASGLCETTAKTIGNLACEFIVNSPCAARKKGIVR